MSRWLLLLLSFVGVAILSQPDAQGADFEPQAQAGRMIEYLVLESGLGLRWTPPPAAAKRLQAALNRPLEGLAPLKAPFARSDSEIVTLEALAWTILAEIAYARYLTLQHAPEALAYLYLASRQVGFAREKLLDPATGLYRPRWRGEAYGRPTLGDQLLMLWALSAYSGVGDLLATEEEGRAEIARLFHRQIGPLADRLFWALRPELSETHPDERARTLWGEALGAYRDAARDPQLAREAERYRKRVPAPPPQVQVEVEATSRSPLVRLSLSGLADLLASVRSAAELEALVRNPAVVRLIGSGVPWPTAVAYDAASGTWRIADPNLETASAMAIAFRLLALSPSESPTEGEPPSPSPLERLAHRLAQLREELSALEAQPTSAPKAPPQQGRKLPEEARSAPPSPLTLWEAMVLGAAALIGLGAALIAWRRGP